MARYDDDNMLVEDDDAIFDLTAMLILFIAVVIFVAPLAAIMTLIAYWPVFEVYQYLYT